MDFNNNRIDRPVSLPPAWLLIMAIIAVITYILSGDPILVVTGTPEVLNMELGGACCTNVPDVDIKIKMSVLEALVVRAERIHSCDLIPEDIAHYDERVACWGEYIDHIATGDTANWLKSVGDCESKWRMVWNSMGYPYYGLYQFGRATFNENCTGNYYDPYDQVNCAKEMYENGMANRWECK